MAKRITVRATIAAGDVAAVVTGLMGVSVDYVTLEVADYESATITNTSRGWTAERRAAQSKRIKALNRARKREAENKK